MRISDWSSDVCSSDLQVVLGAILLDARSAWVLAAAAAAGFVLLVVAHRTLVLPETLRIGLFDLYILGALVSFVLVAVLLVVFRSEEQTSELQSLRRISYAVFCLKKKKNNHEQYVT